MKPCKPYLYEFLYRGRPEPDVPGDPAPAWHIQLESRLDNGMGGVSVAHSTLNMGQAAAAGWTLPTVLAAINTQTLVELERARVEIGRLEQGIAERDEEIARLTPPR